MLQHGRYTVNARVLSREEMYELAATEQNFILFVRSGNEYYALGSEEEAVRVNVSGTLQEGSTLTYIGDDYENIFYDIDAKHDYYEYGNIDITPKSIVTDMYLFPGEEGDLFSADNTWRRPGFNYVSTVAEGINIDRTIGNIIWSWHERYITFSDGQFQNSPLDIDLGTLPATDSDVFYCAVVEEIHENPTVTAKVVSRSEMHDFAAMGNEFIMFIRSGNTYYAVDSEATPVEISLDGELKQGAVITYSGEDADNILWDLDTKEYYTPYNNTDITVRNKKTQMYINPNTSAMFFENTDYRPGFYYINNVAEGFDIDTSISSIFWSWYNQEESTYLQFVDGEFVVTQDVYVDSVIVDDSIAVYVAVVCTPSSIAFNPGNGNNATNSLFDYGGTQGIERVEIDTSYYTNSNGELTITLPADNQLGTSMRIVSGNNTQYTIPKEKAYDYKLVGWYNIATRTYYDVSSGSRNVTISVRDDSGYEVNNVFYGCWIASTYDFGKERQGTEYKAISTNDFITTKVFDYNELFNIKSLSLEQNGTASEVWTDTGYYGNTGISSFVFQKTHAGGTLGWPNEIKDWNVSDNDEAAAGRWETASPNNELLQRLFDESGNTLGVKYLGEGDYLYHKVTDENGNEYYQYDSTKNAASYNQTEQRFYVWDDLQYTYLDEEMVPAFLPFNDEGEQSTTYGIDGTYNFWFGMTTEVSFHLADNVGTPSNKTNQIGNSDGTSMADMIFQFAGDDDVWIYIDGELVVDIGGTHHPMQSEINFSTGEVSVINYNGEDLSDSRGHENILSNLKSGEHKITLYYLERGGGGSNCTITLNMPSRWAGIPPEANTVSVKKEWENTENTTIPETVEITLYDDNTAIETITLNEANNWYYIWEGLNPDGNYSVKEKELESYESKYNNSKSYNHLYWAEISTLADAQEIVVVNSNLTSSGATDSIGYYALNSDLSATRINIQNGVIISNTLTDSMIWTIINTGSGYRIRNKSTGKYLNVTQNGQLSIEDSETDATVFNLSDVKGNRFNANINGSSYSIVYENGSFYARSLGASAGMDYICSRIYAMQTIASTVSEYTITNTYIPSVILKKIDSDDGKPLSDVTFTLVNSVDRYYKEEEWVSEFSPIATDSSGTIKFSKIEDGEYTLTEVSSKSGYHLLNTPITFTVLDEKITSVNGKMVYLDTTDSSSLTIIVENVKGYEIPETGGKGTNSYTFVGLALIAISLFFLKRKNRYKRTEKNVDKR